MFFDVEFEYEVSFSLAIAVSVAEGGGMTIFWDPVYELLTKRILYYIIFTPIRI